MIETSVIIGFTLISTSLIVFSVYYCTDFQNDHLNAMKNRYEMTRNSESYSTNFLIKLSIICLIVQVTCFIFLNSYVLHDSDIMSAKVSYEINAEFDEDQNKQQILRNSQSLPDQEVLRNQETTQNSETLQT